jgi:hypothetical protein
MAKFMFAYTGGSMAETEEERNKAMAAWGAWFGELGSAVVDPGNPFGASGVVTRAGNGAAGALTGYSIVNADDLEAAKGLAGGCPVLSSGGNVEVYEALEM